MPALNFPDGAVANDTYVHEGVEFTYDGTQHLHERRYR